MFNPLHSGLGFYPNCCAIAGVVAIPLFATCNDSIAALFKAALLDKSTGKKPNPMIFYSIAMAIGGFLSGTGGLAVQWISNKAFDVLKL